MAHYRKVETKIWSDARFLSLSAHGKLAYLFILTHPHMTALGAMRTTVPGLTFELPDIPAKAFREVFAKGLAKADEKACMVWLPNFLFYNMPESPNVVRSWPNSFDLLPDCNMKEKLLQTMKAFTEGLSEGFGQAFREGFAEALAKSSPKTSPNPEQEQEQDTPKSPRGSREVLPEPPAELAEAWGLFVQMRKEIRKPLVPTSANALLKKLSKYSPSVANAMLLKSAENSWQGVFDLKDERGKPVTPPSALEDWSAPK